MNLHTFAILAYKDSPYLEECILSLINQSIKSDIYIATATPSIFLYNLAEKYNIPIYVNSASKGIAHDWTFAYNRCATSYVTLAHQDDIYFPEYTCRLLSACRNKHHRLNLIIFSDYKDLIGDKFRVFSVNLYIKKLILLPFLLRRCIYSPFFKKAILSLGNPIQCSGVMYNKKQIGDFDFSDKFCCNMDWDTWLRLAARKGGFVYINQRLMAHRIHRFSQTALNIENMVRMNEDRAIFERLWPKFMAKILSNRYRLALNSYREN